jgi:hypothetical protein
MFRVQGAPQAVAATFSATVVAEFLVTFDESSLPVGVTWYANITGEPSLTTTVTASGLSSAPISLGNGTFTFAVTTNSASWVWNDSTTGTSFQVSGAPRTIALQFSQVVVAPQYAVTFSETGLPSGDRFTVLVDDQNLTEVAPSTLVIHLVNGTYTFTVVNDPPYDANRTSGSVVVHGLAVTVAIAFAQASPSPTTSSASFPWVWVLGGVVVVVALLALLLLLAGRRRKKEQPTTESANSGPSSAPPSGPGAGSG